MNQEITNATPEAGVSPELSELNIPLRDWPRILARLVAMAVLTAPLIGARICVRPLHRIAPDFERIFRRRVMKLWSSGTLRILGVRLRVEGKAPRGHYYIVANHMSYLDVPLFARDLGSVFVAMSEMADWPLVGFVVRHMNTIFINRKDWREVQRVNEVVGMALSEEHSVMVFPESTTSYGHDVLPFRPALLEAAIAAKMPVHYATLRYHSTEWCPEPEHDVCWVDDVPFGVHALRLLRLERIDATIRYGTDPIVVPDRKSMARFLEESVRDQLREFDDRPAKTA
jgi:1-acyl-sn-glycerol-3-phosphate acyltransferase